MTVFISGGAKCGKSSIAQELAVKLSGGQGLFYVATMIPSGNAPPAFHFVDAHGSFLSCGGGVLFAFAAGRAEKQPAAARSV